MKKNLTILFFITILLSVFISKTVYAESCFPKGSISVSGPKGQILQGNVSPMGAISIYYPGFGTLNGYVDSLGYFTATNDEVTLRGSVDTSCPDSSNSQTSNTNSSSNQNLNQWYQNYKSCSSISHATLDDSSDSSGQCVCQSGYVFNSSKTMCLDNSQSLRDISCQANFAPNSVYDKNQGHCVCKDGYSSTLDSSDKLICRTSQEIQDAPQSPSLKEGILNAEKLYPDAGITGNEKTSKELHDKIVKSGSWLAYQKIQPLTADQIIDNMNILGNTKEGTPQDMQAYVNWLANYQNIPRLVTVQHPAYSIVTFVRIIRAHFPQYKDIDDTTLAKRFIEMYPVFKDRVDMNNTVQANVVSKTNTDLFDNVKTQGVVPEPVVEAQSSKDYVPIQVKQSLFQRLTGFIKKLKFW